MISFTLNKYLSIHVGRRSSLPYIWLQEREPPENPVLPASSPTGTPRSWCLAVPIVLSPEGVDFLAHLFFWKRQCLMLAKKHRTFELKTILQTPLTPQSISGWSRPITSSKYLFIKPTRFPIGIFSPLFLHRKHTYRKNIKILRYRWEPLVPLNNGKSARA